MTWADSGVAEAVADWPGPEVYCGVTVKVYDVPAVRPEIVDDVAGAVTLWVPLPVTGVQVMV